MKAIKVTIVLLLFCQAVLAQKISQEQRIEKKLTSLDEKVTLTATQKEEVQAIFTNTATQIQSLRKAGDENKDAMLELRREEREKVKAVLTPEQVTKLKELKKAEREQHKVSRDNIREYHKTNVKPVLEAKRKAFDAALSASEKEIITQAKAKMPEHKKGEDHLKLEKGNKQDYKTARQEMKVLLQPVVDAHKAELEQIFNEVKPILDAEKEFIKENRPEHEPKKGIQIEHRKGKFDGQKGDSNERFMYRFLLMG